MAASLVSSWGEVERAIRDAKRIWLGLDFDGTLAPIEDRPDRVELPLPTREALRSLSTQAGTHVAIISGRELCNLRRIVGLESLAYSGNHGLEIEGPNLAYTSDHSAALCNELIEMADAISRLLANVEQVFVENKRLSLSVHYRLVRPEAHRVVREAVAVVARRHESLHVVPGAMVWEIRPRLPVSKGTAALWLRERQSGLDALPVFIGDDVTDEDAFQAFPDGITIKVGAQRPTAARYAVAGHEKVYWFLTSLLLLRKGT